MEFDFNINMLFGDVVSKVDHRVMPFNRSADLFKEHRSLMMKVLDRMGEASAKAQGLHGPITSGRKLELSDHHLYIMKDPDKNGSSGVVIGFIKVGRKKLFVYDNNGVQHEMNPLCVLDFYVHESRQRRGCGRRLFQHMLQSESVKAQHLAIDRPSAMFTGFLQKHYGLKVVVPQVNNFVVFDGFFKERTDMLGRGGRTGSAGRPPVFPYRRPDVHSRGGHDQIDRFGRRTYHPPSTRPPSGRRQSSATIKIEQEKSALKDVCVRPLPMEVETKTHVQSDLCRKTPPLESLHLNLNGLTRRPGSQSGMTAGVSRYSRHGRSSATPPPRQNSANRSRQNSATQQRQRDVMISNNAVIAAPDVNGNIGMTKRETTPPLLRREVTPVNHHDYMTRGGHLKLAPNATVPSLPSVNTHQATCKEPTSAMSKADSLARNLTSNTTWTVFGIIPSGYQHRQYSQHKYHHTKLW
ncbi:alpha-tubulin N-acetyltransferase 1-like [Liolophura sinensis]|uniref:alpha-tubulin N-acetyltransferase 1-like n=1 Tax=Liolophura sinensis TaxID=3198878 RepID=UPI00315941DC